MHLPLNGPQQERNSNVWQVAPTRVQQRPAARANSKMLSCSLSRVSGTAGSVSAAAVEQKQTVLVLWGLVAHSWTARRAEFLAMVNYRSLWETPKYEPPPSSSRD